MRGVLISPFCCIFVTLWFCTGSTNWSTKLNIYLQKLVVRMNAIPFYTPRVCSEHSFTYLRHIYVHDRRFPVIFLCRKCMISMKMEFYLPKHVGNNSVSKLKIVVFSGVQRWFLMLIRFVQCVVCVWTCSIVQKLKCERILSFFFMFVPGINSIKALFIVPQWCTQL
jgi:hypothetical protein